MKLQTLAATLATVAAAAILACGTAPHTITLASGSHVNVLEEKSEPYKDRHSVEKRAFLVEYESSQDFEDPTALRNEMYEVFDFYKTRVDRGGFTNWISHR